MSEVGVAAEPQAGSLFGKLRAGINKIINWFSVKPVDPGVKGDPEYNPIVTDVIKSDIQLEAKAEELGKANQPPSNAAVWAGTESKIVQIIEKFRITYFTWACDHLHVLNQSISSIDVSPTIRKIRKADKAFEDEANSLLSKTSSNLKTLADDLHSLNGELSDFRTKNSLSWAAHAPSSSMKFFLWTGLGVVVVIEGLINAFFFGQGSNYGLVGGFGYAAMFSLLNVIIGAGLGRQVIPYKNHISSLKKMLGYAGIVFALFMALGISFLISHYRDAMSLDAENATRTALGNLVKNPFALQEVHSWLLFGFSMLFASFAVLDAYKMDDPYPGYGKLTRKVEQARADYYTEMDDLRCQLEALKDNKLSFIDSSIAAVEQKLERLTSEIENKRKTEKKLMTSFKDAEHCLHELLNTFRDKNRIHRTTDPPDYFNEWPALREFDLPDFSIEKDLNYKNSQAQLYKQMEREVAKIKSSIQSSFNAKHDSLKPLDDHFPQSWNSE